LAGSSRFLSDSENPALYAKCIILLMLRGRGAHLVRMFNFFQKISLGIDISDHSIEAISLGGAINRSNLLALGRKKIPEGIVEDGQILNKKDLGKFLKELIDKPKFGKITTKNFIFSLPESKSFIRVFKLPQELKEKEILEYLKSQTKENFPYPPEELYFDYQLPGADEKDVLLAAASRKIVMII
jgi:Tfp pilus assembly PilM family ATPase